MKKLAILLVPFLASGLMLNSIACESGGEEATLAPVTQPSSTITSESPVTLEPVKITIGNLTDITGPSSNALVVITTALEDLVGYYNENSIIPGVELEVINYDTQYDPNKFTTGYEWLKERGADLIFTSVPDTPLALKSIVDKDKMPLFSASGYVEQLDPPGYVFILGTIPEHQAYTFLNWIAENDWGYESNGPAKIGGASWTDGYSQSFIAAMEKYAKAHPDQFEWVGGYLTNFTFTWAPEVEALKDCDYLFPCVMPVAFMKEYRSADGTAKFICADAQTGFFSLISDAELWDDIDGTLFIKGGSMWWNDDDDELINLNKKVLYENHPDEAEAIIRAGSGYLAVAGIYYPMFEMIADAVEAVGAENFDSQALYDAAKSYSLVIDGIERSGFAETRRYALSNYMIYKASAADEDMIRAAENWIPHLVEP
ncbi:MAG: ABC transporter substrate-binding protein [Chloroflexi bacterium]|nr:ABC transporter substrate-binding protein [Chloroflexota bacterium]